MSWEVRHRLLHLRKKPRNDDKLPSLPSFATPQKKNKEMTTNQGGSPSFATNEKKNKEMMMSQGGLLSSTTPKKKKRQQVIFYTRGKERKK